MATRIIKITGIIIALLNIINVVNSTWFFLGMAHFPVTAWLAFNACAPSVALYLAGYFTKRDWLMAAALPFLLFFGTGGLFVFGWSGTAVYAQAGHICMTLAAAWIIAKCAAGSGIKLPAAGLLAGIALFIIAFPLQHGYVKSHPEYIEKLGDKTFEDYMNRSN